MTKHTMRHTSVTFGNENAFQSHDPAHMMKACKPRALTKKKRALVDITNAAQSLSSTSLNAAQQKATGAAHGLTVENPRTREKSLKRTREDAMQLDTDPQSPILSSRPPSSCTVPSSVEAKRLLPHGVLDIDIADAGDHLCEASFAMEIQRNMVKRECNLLANPEYMTMQRDISPKMRAILIDWLVDVHLKFELRPNTLHLTVNVIDRFLAVRPVMRRKLQLVGITAMLIASKYEEIYAPVVADFVYISDKTYSEKEILSMEAVILNALQFKMTLPYMTTFLARNLKALRACVGYDVKEVEWLAMYIVELALQDYHMLQFRYSQIAAAATLLAGILVLEDVVWNDTMVFYSGGWNMEGLMECEVQLRRLLRNEQDPENINKLTALKRKFSAQCYGDIAGIATEVDLSTDEC